MSDKNSDSATILSSFRLSAMPQKIKLLRLWRDSLSVDL